MLCSEFKNKNGYIEPRLFVEAHKGRSSGMKSMMFRKEVLFLLFPFYIFSLWQHMFEHHFCQESEKTWNEAWRGEKPLNNSPSLFYPLFSASFSKGRSFENNIVFKQWGKSSMINPLLFSCFEIVNHKWTGSELKLNWNEDFWPITLPLCLPFY